MLELQEPMRWTYSRTPERLLLHSDTVWNEVKLLRVTLHIQKGPCRMAITMVNDLW